MRSLVLSAPADLMDHSTLPDEAQLAAAAFLARYGGRTLDAYRHDLRMFFVRTGEHGLDVLMVARPHIELYRAAMEERGVGSLDDRPARWSTSPAASVR